MSITSTSLLNVIDLVFSPIHLFNFIFAELGDTSTGPIKMNHTLLLFRTTRVVENSGKKLLVQNMYNT